jgi:aminoglycoside adenylyltransferase-like protein
MNPYLGARITPPPVDSDLGVYLDQVVDRLRGLEAVWLIGSAATGAYVSGRSDVDVVGVSAGPLSEHEKRSIATDLSHERLPCPARKLELPIYTRASVEQPSRDLLPELNLNTGRDEHSVELSDSFWFVLDLALAREHGRTLLGPPPSSVIGEVPRWMALDALRGSLAWAERETPTSPSAVLNACRALRYAREGVWSSKPEAGAWARDLLPRETVDRALALHAGEAAPALTSAAVGAVLQRVRQKAR